MIVPNLALLALLAAPPAANNRPFGLGVILGEPSGISAKYFLDQRHALDLALDFSAVDDAFYVHGDYVLHLPGVLPSLPGGLWLAYVGVGGKLKLRERDRKSDEASLSVRIPLGITWMPRGAPIDVFVELVPGVRVLPSTDPDLDAGLGVRWFF
jgi:hypothetical protein